MRVPVCNVKVDDVIFYHGPCKVEQIERKSKWQAIKCKIIATNILTHERHSINYGQEKNMLHVLERMRCILLSLSDGIRALDDMGSVIYIPMDKTHDLFLTLQAAYRKKTNLQDIELIVLYAEHFRVVVDFHVASFHCSH